MQCRAPRRSRPRRRCTRVATGADLWTLSAASRPCGDRAIFVSESYDSVRRDHSYRPIGGTTEYGECSIDTVVREVRQELSGAIQNVRLFAVLERLFTMEGRERHENDFI